MPADRIEAEHRIDDCGRAARGIGDQIADAVGDFVEERPIAARVLAPVDARPMAAFQLSRSAA